MDWKNKINELLEKLEFNSPEIVLGIDFISNIKNDDFTDEMIDFLQLDSFGIDRTQKLWTVVVLMYITQMLVDNELITKSGIISFLSNNLQDTIFINKAIEILLIHKLINVDTLYDGPDVLFTVDTEFQFFYENVALEELTKDMIASRNYLIKLDMYKLKPDKLLSAPFKKLTENFAISGNTNAVNILNKRDDIALGNKYFMTFLLAHFQAFPDHYSDIHYEFVIDNEEKQERISNTLTNILIVLQDDGIIRFRMNRWRNKVNIRLSNKCIAEFKLPVIKKMPVSKSKGITTSLMKNTKDYDDSDKAVNEFLHIVPNKLIETEKLFYNKELEDELEFYINLFQRDDKILNNNPFIKGKIVLMFEGIPGTGKTAFANQLAKNSGRDVVQVNWHTLQHSYIGQSEKNLKSILDGIDEVSSKKIRVPIVIFNEAEGFLSQRVNVRQHSDRMENTMVSMVLEWLEKRDVFGIVIFTANHVELIDKAFERRITRVNFNMPDRDTRAKIWDHLFRYYGIDLDHNLFIDHELTGAEISKIIQSYGLHKLAFDIRGEKQEVIHRLCGNAKWIEVRPKIGF